ncbi:MAG: WG repeat-containing protein [Bacteroidales bacterium]|nr:WG repeat-containing protein [Bacteroidales bacterium]
MKLRSIILGFCLACICVTAAGQDLKPVKDRDTKLFGYQDKSKNWVIPPSFSAAKRFSGGYALVEVQGLKGLIDESGAWILKPEWDNIDKFDKTGLCEVMRKDGKTKLRGVANQAGQMVIPAECLAISIARNEGLIMAERYVQTQRSGLKPMWGVYNVEGKEIFEPQFASAPSWRNGRGIAKSAYNGLLGVIDSNSKTLLPFDNLAISASGSSLEVLTSDFTTCVYDARMFKSNEYAYPGYVAPYEPAGDPVRAAAWRVGPIGARLHSNNLKLVDMGRDSRSRNAVCSDLRLDWGYGRFVRLEPCLDDKGLPGSMLDPDTDGNYYTIKAILYERDGRFVQEVSRWGWLEAECSDGYIYNAEGAETWIALKDINIPAIPSFSLSLSGYKQIDRSDIYSALGLRSYDVGRMYDPSGAVRRCEQIREGENAGITSYLPRPAPELRSVKLLNEAMRSPLFHYPFRMGQAVNCKVRSDDSGVELSLSETLVCHFEDKIRNPYFNMEGDEEIYWGPHNARTIMLSLEEAPDPKDPACTKDDMFGSERAFVIVIALYEEDGSYLRTLGVEPCLDYASEGYLVFEKLGIALIYDNGFGDYSGHPSGHEKIKTPTRKKTLAGARRLPPAVSALIGAGEGLRPRPGAARRSAY